jgi:hypothetical protein
MEEEVSDSDDYVDWLKWVFDVKNNNHDAFESKDGEKVVVLLQVHETKKDLVKNTFIKSSMFQNTIVTRTRWEEICQNIQVDLDLEMEKTQ